LILADWTHAAIMCLFALSQLGSGLIVLLFTTTFKYVSIISNVLNS
jgi:hypothetical protein